MTVLRVGILGAGGIAARHAKAIASLSDHMTLVASCGRDKDKTEAFAASHGGAAYTDFEAMIGDAAIDFLVVALPPFAHTGQVERAAAAGIHVLVEKPIALDLDRATTMVEACERAKIVAACGFMYRFGAGMTRWDQLGAQGKTGPVGHFSGQFHCNALHADWWRERDKAGGQMVEQLIHIVDLARHTMGMPQTVYARAANLFHTDVPRYDTEDVSAMILGYDTGAIGVLNASNIAVPGRWDKGWQILARDMAGQFSDFNVAKIVPVAAPDTAETIAAETDVFAAQLADVAEAILHKRAPRVPLRDGLDSLRIVLAARQSAQERREITLPPPARETAP